MLEELEMEAEAREQRKIARLLRRFPIAPGARPSRPSTSTPCRRAEKFRLKPPTLGRKLRELAGGDFLEGAVNLLAFGAPGAGKSHVACALGHAPEGGHAALFRPAYQLVQELLAPSAI